MGEFGQIHLAQKQNRARFRPEAGHPCAQGYRGFLHHVRHSHIAGEADCHVTGDGIRTAVRTASHEQGADRNIRYLPSRTTCRQAQGMHAGTQPAEIQRNRESSLRVGIRRYAVGQ